MGHVTPKSILNTLKNAHKSSSWFGLVSYKREQNSLGVGEFSTLTTSARNTISKNGEFIVVANILFLVPVQSITYIGVIS